VSHPAEFALELTTALTEIGPTAINRPNTHRPQHRFL
jgi:hypothetical protein